MILPHIHYILCDWSSAYTISMPFRFIITNFVNIFQKLIARIFIK